VSRWNAGLTPTPALTPNLIPNLHLNLSLSPAANLQDRVIEQAREL
jgi:hypothetical protein